MNPLASDLDHVLAHTERLWGELRRRQIFITGGTGFFGSWLLESFIYANDRLNLGSTAVVLTRNPAAFHRRAPHLAKHPAIKLHVGDMAGFEFPHGNFSHVIHAASELNVPQLSNGKNLTETTTQNTKRILNFAKQVRASKFLFTSSGAVYGPGLSGQRFREEDDLAAIPPDPRWDYARAKRKSETLCESFGHENGIEIKIARGFAFLGPYLSLDAHFAAGNFIRDALRDEPITVRGSGTAMRSYLYGADLAIWLWTILFRGAPSHPYNVGSDMAISVEELAQAIASECNLPVQMFDSENEATNVYMPDISRARLELGLEVYTSLVEAIRRTLRFYDNETICGKQL